ncbi:MAG: class I SAM-dependent methyltransferase [Cyanobacteria bacterium J06592_8]
MTSLMFDYAELPYGSGKDQKARNRFNWRYELLFTRNKELIQDKVILDLACNNGRLSYPCLALGAKKIIGVEARQELIETGKKYLHGTGFENKMEFIQADLFEYMSSVSKGEFDLILCCGFLYHTVKQVEFFRLLKQISPSSTIIDTNVATNYCWYGLKNFLKKPPMLYMIIEDPDKTSDTTDIDGVAFWPTPSFLESMFDVIGYDYRQIRYSSREIKDWYGMNDYKKGYRVSYVGHRKS